MALAVAPCGPRLWTLDKGPRLVSCRLDALGRGAGGAPAGGSELHCLPCLPAALSEGAVVALAASGAQDALLVASANAVAVVRLPSGAGADGCSPFQYARAPGLISPRGCRMRQQSPPS